MGKFKLKQHDGWFSNDSLSLTVNLTTPLAGLHSAALLLHTHSDPSQVSFIQVEFEDIKVMDVFIYCYRILNSESFS